MPQQEREQHTNRQRRRGRQRQRANRGVSALRQRRNQRDDEADPEYHHHIADNGYEEAPEQQLQIARLRQRRGATQMRQCRAQRPGISGHAEMRLPVAQSFALQP